MQKINVKDARRNISRLLDRVNAGEEIIIFRRGKPVARMLQVDNQGSDPVRFPERSAFRSKLPGCWGWKACLPVGPDNGYNYRKFLTG